MKFEEFEPWRIRMAQAFDANPDIEMMLTFLIDMLIKVSIW